MQIAARFSLDARGLDALRTRAPQAITRALNRSIASAKTVMVREVSQDMGLKAGDIRELIGVREARPDRQAAQLTASFKRVPVMDFSARDVRPGGVTARLSRVQARYPRAFIATMRSGHRGVFARKGTTRLPIRELFGPSIARVFLKHVDVGLARGQEQLVKNLQSEFQHAMRGTP